MDNNVDQKSFINAFFSGLPEQGRKKNYSFSSLWGDSFAIWLLTRILQVSVRVAYVQRNDLVHDFREFFPVHIVVLAVQSIMRRNVGCEWKKILLRWSYFLMNVNWFCIIRFTYWSCPQNIRRWIWERTMNSRWCCNCTWSGWRESPHRCSTRVLPSQCWGRMKTPIMSHRQPLTNVRVHMYQLTRDSWR